MPEKELRKKVIGKNGLSNLLLALKIGHYKITRGRGDPVK